MRFFGPCLQAALDGRCVMLSRLDASSMDRPALLARFCWYTHRFATIGASSDPVELVKVTALLALPDGAALAEIRSADTASGTKIYRLQKRCALSSSPLKSITSSQGL